MEKHILVVEDEEAMRKTFHLLLMTRGYIPHLAENGQVALEFIKKSRIPNLVITDICMPTMGGVELISAIRADLPQLPIGVITGALTPALTDTLHGLNCEQILEKPFTATEFENWVDKLVE